MIHNPLCIYHGGCDDGFAAAWVVRRMTTALACFEFYPGVYQEDPPDVTDRDVLMVDFSYKRPVLEEMAKTARSITILDHHKTAAEDLAGFPRPAPFSLWGHPAPLAELNRSPIAALFYMDRCGASMAWSFFSDDSYSRSLFIDYIEDRDLWRMELHDGNFFTMALRSYPQDFDVWDELVARGDLALIEEGRHIHRYYRLRVEEAKDHAYRAWLSSFEGWIANAPYFLASEVAGELCEREGAQFGACYFEVAPGKWQYSLRSRGDFDVSSVAKLYGGGGHKNAAGFSVSEPAHWSTPHHQ